jgi:hypothetical protein
MIPEGYPTDIKEIFCFCGCFKFGIAHGAGHSPNKHPSAPLYILYGRWLCRLSTTIIGFFPEISQNTLQSIWNPSFFCWQTALYQLFQYSHQSDAEYTLVPRSSRTCYIHLLRNWDPQHLVVEPLKFRMLCHWLAAQQGFSIKPRQAKKTSF